MRLTTLVRCGFLLLATVVLGTGCSHRPRATTAAPPEVAVEAHPTPTPMPEQMVTEPGAETTPSEAVQEELPDDIQELNRRGYLEDVFFDTDRHDLRPEASEALGKNAAWLQQYRSVMILVEGHCDERNTREYNIALGERRANAVREYLVFLGIPAERILTRSYGEERPFATGHDESAWRLNRRAHFVITAR